MFNASFNFSSTISGVICLKHAVVPRGQSRLKQGLHSRFRKTVFALCDNGGVYPVVDEPYTAINGVPTAAVTCISPESLVTTISQCASKSIASVRDVFPVSIKHFDLSS